MFLHTLPLGALIYYNNTSNEESIEYDETVFQITKILFISSLALNLIEICSFYICKAVGSNIEVRITETFVKKAYMPTMVAKAFGFMSVGLCVIAIILAPQIFSEMYCLDSWFLDSDKIICKDCAI